MASNPFSVAHITYVEGTMYRRLLQEVYKLMLILIQCKFLITQLKQFDFLCLSDSVMSRLSHT